MHIFRAISGTTGTFYKGNPGATSYSALAKPAGCTVKANRPSDAKIRARNGLLPTVIVGGFDPGVIWFETLANWYEIGITAPGSAPSVATSGTGLTGEALCYLNFRHKSGSTVIHQSNLSPSSSLTLTNQGVAWTSIPTTHANSRVTHVGLWRSMGGDVPRLVADLTLGTASHTESVSDAARQGNEAAPTYIDANGETQVDDEARGIPPYCTMVAAYNYRAWYAGDPNFPSRLYRSRIGEPESVNRGEDRPGHDDTPNGEAITGLGAGANNELIVFHAFGAYAVEGFGDSDIRWRVLLGSLGYGCINHFGIQNCGGWLQYPSQQGICVYDGAFRNVMEHSRKSEWIADYKANVAAYEAGWSTFNPLTGKYLFVVERGSAPKTYGWDSLTRPMVVDGEREPYWANRKVGRAETFGRMMFDSTGMNPQPYYGGEDGYVRKDDPADADDDGDTNTKKWVVEFPHLVPDPAGDAGQGIKVTSLALGLKNEVTDVDVKVYSGHDEAHTAGSPQWAQTIKARQETVAGRTRTPRKTWRGKPNCTGQGALVHLEAESPLGLELTGMELDYEPGEKTDPLT